MLWGAVAFCKHSKIHIFLQSLKKKKTGLEDYAVLGILQIDVESVMVSNIRCWPDTSQSGWGVP